MSLVDAPQPGISAAAIVERVVIAGDLGALKPEERVAYYARLCESLGLNPLTKPFEYIRLDGKLTLYCRKDAAEQLRKLNGVSIDGLDYPPSPETLLVVVARGHDRTGRTDSASGVVSLGGLSGANLANAYMRAETKAKRRLTLSLVGLGFPDESELETIASAEPVAVNELGEVAPRATLAEVVAARAAQVQDQDAESVAIEPEDVQPEAESEELFVTPLTYDQFMRAVKDVNVTTVRQARVELYPEAKAWSDLTPTDLARVADLALRNMSAAEVHDEPPTDATKLQVVRNEPVTPVETTEPESDPVELVSAAEASNACTSTSPFDGLPCDLPVGHKGSHRAGETETW